MKITRRQIRKIIQEATSYAPTEVYMDLMRRGGPDYWLSKAHGSPMKISDMMHYDQALRAYIDEVDPSLKNMSSRDWSTITNLMKQTR